jgi:hypothetical protein
MAQTTDSRSIKEVMRTDQLLGENVFSNNDDQAWPVVIKSKRVMREMPSRCRAEPLRDGSGSPVIVVGVSSLQKVHGSGSH